jgi:hypothetical protein
MATQPTPTPETQNSLAAPDENTPQPEERDGFFRQAQRVFNPVSPPVHPSERDEIVIDLPPIERTDPDEQT